MIIRSFHGQTVAVQAAVSVWCSRKNRVEAIQSRRCPVCITARPRLWRGPAYLASARLRRPAAPLSRLGDCLSPGFAKIIQRLLCRCLFYHGDGERSQSWAADRIDPGFAPWFWFQTVPGGTIPRTERTMIANERGPSGNPARYPARTCRSISARRSLGNTCRRWAILLGPVE